jgi:broad specificity phosphatase PhoE
MNGKPPGEVHAAVHGIDERYPGPDGESWREAVLRCGEALMDLDRRWPDGRVLVIGHVATYWAVQHRYAGLPFEAIGSGFVWQEGWELERKGD